MIQRIQTVYLLLTTILAVLFLSGTIINFENGTNLNLEGISGVVSPGPENSKNELLPLTILLIAVPIMSLLTIFIYRNRKSQMKLTILLIILILLEIAAVAYYTHYIMGNFNTDPVPGLKLILPVLMLIFAILAYRGIREDEKLVRSYDRLR
jgi:peptidoglycan/LPS O-acetylase OafA/YrhL